MHRLPRSCHAHPTGSPLGGGAAHPCSQPQGATRPSSEPFPLLCSSLLERSSGPRDACPTRATALTRVACTVRSHFLPLSVQPERCNLKHPH